jgi:cytidylate kinase
MAIITISRGCYSHGKEIAEAVARKLDYELVSREILLEASQFFDVSEEILQKTIHDAPSIMERLTHGREKYLSFIQAALLEHVKNDNAVYHGHGGHLLLPEIGHVLKVRVIAKKEERVAHLLKEKNISAEEAEDYIDKEDKHRAGWTHYLYHMDINDSNLYDIVIHIDRLGIEDAAEIICSAACTPTYQTTSRSQKAVCDLALGTHIKALLQDVCEADVRANGGIVHVETHGQDVKKTSVASTHTQEQFQDSVKDELTREITEIALEVPGVKSVSCSIGKPKYH